MEIGDIVYVNGAILKCVGFGLPDAGEPYAGLNRVADYPHKHTVIMSARLHEKDEPGHMLLDSSFQHLKVDHVCEGVRQYGREVGLPPEIPEVYSTKQTKDDVRFGYVMKEVTLEEAKEFFPDVGDGKSLYSVSSPQYDDEPTQKSPDTIVTPEEFKQSIKESGFVDELNGIMEDGKNIDRYLSTQNTEHGENCYCGKCYVAFKRHLSPKTSE